MFTIVIYNPVAGDGKARIFVEEHVLPLLGKHRKPICQVMATQSSGHAGLIVKDALKTCGQELNIILGSGDGCLHEIVNALHSEVGHIMQLRLRFAILPCGTANALYSSFFPSANESMTVDHKLQSLKAFISQPTMKPLSLAKTTLLSPPAEENSNISLSVAVVSTALHAMILRDSERLREQMPGIERFKVAARENSKRWYNSTVKLLPLARAGFVQIYDPGTKDFVRHETNDIDRTLKLNGPFAYFLSTVNVDRLEPTFRITPLATTIPPTEPCLDLVVVRPLRCPNISVNNAEDRQSFVSNLWTVMNSAYNDGDHINLRYGAAGQIGISGNQAVVEYFRCGGWEWVPQSSDENAHTVCTDGSISIIGKDGKVRCEVGKVDNMSLEIYA